MTNTVSITTQVPREVMREMAQARLDHFARGDATVRVFHPRMDRFVNRGATPAERAFEVFRMRDVLRTLGGRVVEVGMGREPIDYADTL